MKKSTNKFIIELLENELDAEYYDGFLDQKELDDYTKDLIEASVDYISNNGEWYDKYNLKDKLEKYGIIENMNSTK